MPSVRSFPSLLVLALSASISLFLAGCGSSAPTADAPGLPAGFPNHSVEEIHRAISQSSDTLRTFSATARISVRSPEGTQLFTAQVRQRRADSLYMSIRKLGIEGGRMLLTQDSVFFFDTRKAVLLVGSVGKVREIFPAPITSDALFQNMLGVIAPQPSRQWSLEADSSLYYVTGGNHRREYVVDPMRWRVVRFVKQARDGAVLEKRTFSDFRRVEGVLVPHRVVFRRPADGLSAVVSYQDIDLNPTDLSFSLGVPSQVRRRPLR